MQKPCQPPLVARGGVVLDDGGDKKANLRIFLRSVNFKVRCGLYSVVR